MLVVNLSGIFYIGNFMYKLLDTARLRAAISLNLKVSSPNWVNSQLIHRSLA